MIPNRQSYNLTSRLSPPPTFPLPGGKGGTVILSGSPVCLPLSPRERGQGGEVCARHGVALWRNHSCPHHQGTHRSTNAFPDRRTTRAERADPSGNTVRYASKGDRPADPVHPVSVFALCIWQAPRPVATFGSFWSLQKEHAVGREFGEMWMLKLILVFDSRSCFKLTAEC